MNYYQILELNETADLEEIKKAYKRLAKKYHPDTHPQNLEIHHKFKQISEAYSVLGNVEKRKKYDETFKISKTNFVKKDKSYSNSFNDMQKKNPMDTTKIFEAFMKFK